MLVILGELSGLGGATLSLSFEATLGGSLGLAGVGDFFICEDDPVS